MVWGAGRGVPGSSHCGPVGLGRGGLESSSALVELRTKELIFRKHSEQGLAPVLTEESPPSCVSLGAEPCGPRWLLECQPAWPQDRTFPSPWAEQQCAQLAQSSCRPSTIPLNNTPAPFAMTVPPGHLSSFPRETLQNNHQVSCQCLQDSPRQPIPWG